MSVTLILSQKPRFHPKPSSNCPRRGLNVFEDLLIAEADHCPAIRFDLSLPFLVVFINVVVVPAIDFDDQLLIDAGKVRDEWRNGKLASELEVAQAAGSESTPEE